MPKNKTDSTIEKNKTRESKVCHTILSKSENTTSPIYPAIDNDLAIDNLQNDITAADLQDLE